MIVDLRVYPDGTVVDPYGCLIGHITEKANGLWSVKLVNKKKSPPFVSRALAIDFIARNG